MNTSRPLRGLRILVTREASQAHGLGRMLEETGARVFLCPLIGFRPPDDWSAVDLALAALSDYQGLIFTSVNAVRFFFSRMKERLVRPDSLHEIPCFAVGPGTARAIQEEGLSVKALPERFQAEGLASLLENLEPKGKRFLLPRAREAREVLPASLTQMGAKVDLVVVYETRRAHENRERLQALLAARSIDYATFTSSSTVDAFAEFSHSGNRGLPWRQIRAACIGEVTAASARAHGFSRLVVARKATLDGLVHAIIECEQFHPVSGEHGAVPGSERDQP